VAGLLRRACTCIIVVALAASGATAEPLAGFPANPGFEDGLDGWTVLAPDGAASVEAGGGATGQRALSLRDGWVISAPGGEAVAGWLAVSLRARPPGNSDDAGSLLVAMTASDDRPPEALASLDAEAFRRGWRSVCVEMVAPRGGEARIALGVDGAQPWLLDAVAVEPIDRAAPPDAGVVLPNDLPAGWEPDGLLDARERTIAAMRELLVDVGGLEIGTPDAVTAPRGRRGVLPVTVVNRGQREKQLTISVAGPPGFFVPERTVTIRPSGTTVFNASVQSFALGDAWVRITFSCEDDRAETPVRVTTTVSYPAAGACWLSGTPSADELAAAASLDAQVYAVLAPSDGAADVFRGLPPALTRLALLGAPWSEASARAAARTLSGRADALAIYRPRAEQPPEDVSALVGALGDQETALVLGPPLDLEPGPPPTLANDDLEVACGLGEARAIAAPMLRLPALQAAALAEVSVDGRPVTAAQPCWTRLQAAANLDAVAAAIRARARLPLFISELAASPSGSPTADALVMARVLTAVAWQGLTGFTLPARPSDCPSGAAALSLLDEQGAPRDVIGRAFAELARELAGAVPLRAWSQTEQIGLSDDALIGFRPFMRGDEGLLALWNNTGADAGLMFETRTQPLDIHGVEIGPAGVRRTYIGAFHYSEDAIALNRPVVFVSLGPGQFKLLSMQLADPHAGWLGAVEFAPEPERERRNPRDFYEQWLERQAGM